MVTVTDIYRFVREMEEHAERQMERGIHDNTPAGIVQAQLALGCKFGMRELRHKIDVSEQAAKRVALYHEQEQQHKQEARSRRKPAGRVEPDSVPSSAEAKL